MRMIALAAATSLLCGAAAAQPAAAPAPLTLPKAFAEYSQPEITPGLCKNLSPTQTQCVIPAMTAGVYEITASGTSTATAAGAVQRVGIALGDQATCGGRQNDPKKAAWPVNTPKTLRYICVAYILTDKPLIITAGYDDTNATKDPKGPTLAFKRRPWPGLLMVQPGPAAQQ